jgi:tetratricopeptide (TPR) repeat protein
MQLWADHCAWNFRHRLELLQAEEQFSYGDFEGAKDLYSRAIASSRTHRFINEEALACELAGRFYLETGDLTTSMTHFRLAHEKYQTWGAIGKATQLFNYITEQFQPRGPSLMPLQTRDTNMQNSPC